MGLFDQFFKGNEDDPLSETSVGKKFCDEEKYTKDFTNALNSSYKNFLMAVTDSIIDCEDGEALYGILDVAKKVEAETVADKDAESQKRLETYKETVMASSKEDTSKEKIKALTEYKRSLLSEVYDKYCMPKVYQQIAKEIVDVLCNVSDVSDKQQKLDIVAAHLCKYHDRYQRYGCFDRYADNVYSEIAVTNGMGVGSFYWPENYEIEKELTYNDNILHGVNMFDQNGLAAISKELEIADKNALRDAFINKYIENNPAALAELVEEQVINGYYPGLSLKELKDIVPATKGMSNKEFCSFVCSTNLDIGYYDQWDYSDKFNQANVILKEVSYNDTRKKAWKEVGVSLNEVIVDLVLTNGKRYLDTYFENVNGWMNSLMENESVTKKPFVFKNFFVNDIKALSEDGFRQNYPALASAIYDVVKSDPAKYEPKIAALKEAARDNVVSMYNSQGLKELLENKDPWNSLHPTSLSTIVNNETYIAYERDRENTPTFYVFGKLDQNMLKDVNDVIGERLKTKGAAEGTEYRIVISNGKEEGSAYKANLGNPKSLSVTTPSKENTETRQWLQAVVKYKADNGYEKVFFGHAPREQKKGSRHNSPKDSLRPR